VGSKAEGAGALRNRLLIFLSWWHLSLIRRCFEKVYLFNEVLRQKKVSRKFAPYYAVRLVANKPILLEPRCVGQRKVWADGVMNSTAARVCFDDMAAIIFGDVAEVDIAPWYLV